MKLYHNFFTLLIPAFCTAIFTGCGDGHHLNGNLKALTSPGPGTTTNLLPIAKSTLTDVKMGGQSFLLGTDHTYNDQNQSTSLRSTAWHISVNGTEILSIPLAPNSQSLSISGLAPGSTQSSLNIIDLSHFLSSLGYTSLLSSTDQICFKSQVKNGLNTLSTDLSPPVCTTLTPAIGCTHRPSPATDYHEVGDGSLAAPFELWTPEQFYSFSQGADTGASYIQCSDIDFTNFYLTNPEFQANFNFSGTYDGNGFILNHFQQSDAFTVNFERGLFFQLTGATLTNMNLVNAQFNTSSTLVLGTLAASAQNSNVSHTTVQFNSQSNDTKELAGMIRSCDQVHFEQTQVVATIQSGFLNGVGGICTSTSGSTFLQSHTHLTLTAETLSHVGGLLTEGKSNTIEQCSMTTDATQKDLGLGMISGSKAYLCGLAFNLDSSTVTETFSKLNFKQEINIYTHGIIGFTGNSTGNTSYSDSYAKVNALILADTFDEVSGFSGHTYDGSFNRIYSDVTVNSTTSTFTGAAQEYHAGLVTEEPSSPLSMKDVFTVSHVTSVDPAYRAVFNRTIANETLGTDMSTVYYASDTPCSGCGIYSSHPALQSSFYSAGNAPLNAWDFTSIWKENTGTYPTLINNPE
jgi:hypothetical protein